MNKVARFKEALKQEEVDAIIISKPTNRRYLSGFTGSSGVLLLSKSRDYLITDFRYKEQGCKQAKGFEVIQYEESLVKSLQEIIQKLSLKRVGVEKDTVTLDTYQEYVENIKEADFIPVGDYCSGLRQIKTREEIVLLKKAISLADAAFLHIREFVRVGQTEKEVAAELEYYMRKLGAEKNAFDTIAASGVRSSLPHGLASNKVIKKGDFVTLDFGAVYEGYHSDMTRTLIMGQPDAKQSKIYNTVLTAQTEAERKIKPGMTGKEADSIAREIIEEAGYGEHFGHSLGHAVGLDIHEKPFLSPRDDSVLKAGVVVSVEPGIYLPDWGGVRIEDLVLITPQGCEVLTKSPKNINEMIIDK